MKRDWIKEQIEKLLDDTIGDTDRGERIVAWLEGEGLINTNYGDPEVSTIVESFKEHFGTTKTSKWDRFAAKRLASKHGVDRILAVIDALSMVGGDKYAPSVNNVSQIEEKWVAIIRFLGGKVESEGVKEL